MIELTPLEKILVGAQLICDSCGKIKQLDRDRVGDYLSHGWPKHCGETMRLVARAEQEAGKE